MAIALQRRQRIRTNLKRHMDGGRISARKVAAYINGDPDTFDGFTISADSVRNFLDLNAGTVGDDRVLVLEKYLEVIKSDTASKLPTRRNNHNGDLFFTAQSFFKMTPRKDKQYRNGVIGTYAFYAYSEKGRERVCRGAIEFTVGPLNQLTVKELQRSIPDGGEIAYNEFFNGHFIFRKDSVIAFLRDEKDGYPKVYILSIEPYPGDDGNYHVMEGALLKMGAQRNVFMGNIYMVRKSTAFEECAMLDPSDVPPPIITCLNSSRWQAT